MHSIAQGVKDIPADKAIPCSLSDFKERENDAKS
jgi:hypothetical protein